MKISKQNIVKLIKEEVRSFIANNTELDLKQSFLGTVYFDNSNKQNNNRSFRKIVENILIQNNCQLLNYNLGVNSCTFEFLPNYPLSGYDMWDAIRIDISDALDEYRDMFTKYEIYIEEDSDGSYLGEKKLTKKEKIGLKKMEKSVPKKGFEKQYGKEEGEKIYYATLTKQAKKKY